MMRLLWILVFVLVTALATGLLVLSELGMEGAHKLRGLSSQSTHLRLHLAMNTFHLLAVHDVDTHRCLTRRRIDRDPVVFRALRRVGGAASAGTLRRGLAVGGTIL